MKSLPTNHSSGCAAGLLAILISFQFTHVSAQSGVWNEVIATNSPTNRHECSFAQLGEQFYLLGGRGLKQVEAYDPATNTWNALGFTPQEIHHFQATEFHGLLYLICAFEGNFPSETGIPFVYIYDPLTDSWFVGPDVPVDRIRGSAGVVLYNEKFYVVSGLTGGHSSGWVKWFDEFDPATNTWTILPDAPRARDHFAAAVIDDQLVCAGGRRSGAGTGFFGTFDSVVLKTDVYDFNTGIWSTLASPAGNIPTGRAGASTAVLEGEVIVIGGESSTQSSAHKQTQALDLASGTWRSLTNLNIGRHGSQAIVSNGGVYIACGGGTRGGNMELNSMEAFHFGTPTSPSGIALSAGLPGASSPIIPDAEPGSVVPFQINTDHVSGNQAILIHDIILSGDFAFSLADSFSFPLALAPGASLPSNLTFSPIDTGAFSANLRVVFGAGLDTLVIPIEANSQVLCQTDFAPTGLSSIISGSSVQLTWNEIPQAVKCELQGRKVGATNFSKLRFDVPPASLSLPLATFKPATSYEWKVRCACTLSPLTATPFSSLDTFTTPSLRTAGNTAVEWAISPNPASSVIEVSGPETNGSWTVELTDMVGRKLRIWTVENSTATFDRGDLPSGSYLLSFRSGSQFETRPLILD